MPGGPWTQNHTMISIPAIVAYPEKYKFSEAVARIFGVEDLDHLHALAPGVNIQDRAEDQKTVFHRKFYESRAEVMEVYLDFIKKWVPEVMGTDDLVYQTVPTFRVHLPGGLAVGEFHKDSDYAHSRREINFWLPFTHAFGSNSIWIESQEDLGDYRPASVPKGQVFVFPGGVLKHGNHQNETGVTRVSFDFRVIPREEFSPTGTHSVSAGVEMRIGGYYSQLKK